MLPFELLRIIIGLKCLRVITLEYKQLDKTEATLSSVSTRVESRILQLRLTAVHNSLFTVQAAIRYHLKIGIFIYSHFSRKAHTVRNVVELLPLHEMWLEAGTV